MTSAVETLRSTWYDNLLHQSRGRWLWNARFDLTFITLSAGVAFVPILLYYIVYYAMGGSSAAETAIGWGEDAATMGVMVLVGGPHVFTTYLRTYLDKDFRRNARGWFLASFVLLAAVPAMSWYSEFTWRILMTCFFFAASLHILHQIAYLVRCYNEREKHAPPAWHRWVEWVMLFTSLYPVASYRMVHGDFHIGRVQPMLPAFFLHDWFWMLPTALFTVSVILFFYKTAWEARHGWFHPPKFLLIMITALMGLIVPSMPNLDSAFQGYNAWHSFQYLGLIWYINRLRHERGEISSSFVKALSAPGRGRRLYLSALAATLGLMVLLAGIAFGLGLDTVRTYNSIAMAFILVHYFHDGYFFVSKTY